jgi:hydrogenase nickel incorporation protein HypA/HybF
MSIAMSILDIAHEQARAAGARVVNRIELDLGGLAGIEVESLRFCFAAARRGMTAGAELAIHEIPGRARCADCAATCALEVPIALCPACGSLGLEILQGRELRVRSLNVD